jgi:hypothetical protein
MPRLLMNFQNGNEWSCHFIEANCRTPVSGYIPANLRHQVQRSGHPTSWMSLACSVLVAGCTLEPHQAVRAILVRAQGRSSSTIEFHLDQDGFRKPAGNALRLRPRGDLQLRQTLRQTTALRSLG